MRWCDRHADGSAWRSLRDTPRAECSIRTRYAAGDQPPGRSHVTASKPSLFIGLSSNGCLAQAHTFGRCSVHTLRRECGPEGSGQCIPWGENCPSRRTFAHWHHLTSPDNLRGDRFVSGRGTSASRLRSRVSLEPTKRLLLEPLRGNLDLVRVHTFGREVCIPWGEARLRRPTISPQFKPRQTPSGIAFIPSLSALSGCRTRLRGRAYHGERTALYQLSIDVIAFSSSGPDPTTRSLVHAHTFERAPVCNRFGSVLTYRRGDAYRRARGCIPTGEKVHTFKRDTAYFRERNSTLTTFRSRICRCMTLYYM
jgi:hypothetical protein